MDFGKNADGSNRTFLDVEAEALTAALREDAEKSERASSAAKEGCSMFFIGLASHLFNAMLLMFAVAIIGHPLGYLTCLLLAYTVSSIIGTSTLGEYMTLNKIYKQLGGK